MVSIEDPFDQDDWDGYRPFTAAMGEKARPIRVAFLQHLKPDKHMSADPQLGAASWFSPFPCADPTSKGRHQDPELKFI